MYTADHCVYCFFRCLWIIPLHTVRPELSSLEFVIARGIYISLRPIVDRSSRVLFSLSSRSRGGTHTHTLYFFRSGQYGHLPRGALKWRKKAAAAQGEIGVNGSPKDLPAASSSRFYEFSIAAAREREGKRESWATQIKILAQLLHLSPWASPPPSSSSSSSIYIRVSSLTLADGRVCVCVRRRSLFIHHSCARVLSIPFSDFFFRSPSLSFPFSPSLSVFIIFSLGANSRLIFIVMYRATSFRELISNSEFNLYVYI